MPRLGVLFDIERLDGHDYRQAAYQTLFAALSPAQLAGCSLSDGETEATEGGNVRILCIAIASDDDARIALVRSVLSDSDLRGLAPPTAQLAVRLLEETQVNDESLIQTARINDAGELVDCEQDWLRQAWELSQERRAISTIGQSAETMAAEPFSLRKNPAIPVELPRSLTYREARLRLLAGLMGAGLGIVTSVALFLVARKGGMLEQMFDLRSFSTLIPITISSMFFWGALICLWRWLRLRALERMSAKSLLLEATKYLSVTDPATLAKEIGDPVCAASPLLRRLQAVVKQWLIRPSLQDADLILQQHIAHDEEAIHAGYNLVRTFVWALPVLGLIGTVIGISLAVGGFAQFLGGNIDDVAIVKQNLVGVTGGLSFAFLITLHGLGASLLLMLAASGLQTREEKLYAATQQGITDHFLPALQEVAPALESAGAGEAMAAWRETLQRLAGGVVETLRAESLRSLAAMDDRQMAQREQTLEWAQALRNETEAGAARLGAAASRVGAELASASGDFLERLAQVRAASGQQAEIWRETLEAPIRAATQQQTEMKTALSDQAQALRTAAGALAGLDTTTRSAMERQMALQSALGQLNGAQVSQAFTGFAAALAEQSSQMRSVTEALIGVTRMTGETLRAQAELQASVSQLRDAGLAQTLADFRDSLTHLGPVLESFRQPFVWQAMPVPANAHGAD